MIPIVFDRFSISVSMAFLNDLLHLFYPEACAACGNSLYEGERSICMLCRMLLPRTGFESEPGNPVEKQFWGKVNIRAAASLYSFRKGSKVQHLVHRLKYHGDTEAGTEAGRILGAALKDSGRFAGIDAVAPVPLHRKRLLTRGYNQSQPVSEGIAEILQVPCVPELLKRIKASESQTSRGRYARWENAGTAFSVGSPDEVKGRHILLADDVITTGSTLSACAEVLLDHGAAGVSVASLAFAVR